MKKIVLAVTVILFFVSNVFALKIGAAPASIKAKKGSEITVSITDMGRGDNVIKITIPGAMESPSLNAKGKGWFAVKAKGCKVNKISISGYVITLSVSGISANGSILVTLGSKIKKGKGVSIKTPGTLKISASDAHGDALPATITVVK